MAAEDAENKIIHIVFLIFLSVSVDRREKAKQEIKLEDVVVGDIVHLSAGI